MRGNIWDPITGATLPFTMALLNNLGAAGAPAVTDDSGKGYAIGSWWIRTNGAAYVLTDATVGAAVWTAISETENGVGGVAAGYKVARGIHTQVAASDTIVTGLATVVAAVVSFQSAPTVKQMFATADIGDQSGAPAAGSILINTLKPTAVNDVTPVVATDFTDNIKLAWIAVGT